MTRGTDEAIEAAGKGGDDTAKNGDVGGSLGDEIADTSKRMIRQQALESLYEDKTASNSFTLPAHYYGGYKIDSGQRTQLTFKYTELFNDSIDCFLLDEQTFSKYKSTGEIHTSDLGYVSSEIHTATLAPVTTNYLIFDNTDAGLTPAKDEIQIDTEASLAIID